jgi:hypothetical protein
VFWGGKQATPLPLGFFRGQCRLGVCGWFFGWFFLRSTIEKLHESFEFCEADYFVEVEAECVEDLVEC